MSKTARLFLAISILPQVLIVRVLSHYPEVVETYYSQGLYPFLSKTFRFIFGWIPFSVGDVLIALIILYVLRWFVLNFKWFFKTPKSVIIELFTVISVVYFMFHLLWGFNYYRIPLNKQLGIAIEYSTTDLEEITKKLILSSNSIHLELVKDSSDLIQIPYDFKTIGNKISEGFNLNTKYYPFLKYSPSSQKQSLFSLLQSYMGFSGYLNPLTHEAQVNYYTPANSLPLTLAHEQAHQLGYAAENEANFLAFFTTNNHMDPFIRYASHTFALKYCLNDLYKQNPDEFKRIVATLNSGILKDFKKRQQQWEQFKNRMEPYFKSGYNTYLKVNQQKEGIQSYDHVVALLVNYLKNPIDNKIQYLH